MIWFLLVCGVTWFAILKSIKLLNPKSKGGVANRPNTKLQEKASNVKRPKQGSSRGEVPDSGVLYLVTHDEFNSAKIGISSNSSKGNRLQDHTQYGWKVDGLWVFDRLRNAEQVEGAVIAWWRNTLSLRPSCTPSQMPQGGYTETVSLASIQVTKIIPFVEELVKTTDGQKAVQVSMNKLIPGASMQTEGNLKHASTDRRTAVFKGNYGVAKVHHEWHRWVLDDGTGQLIVELRARDSVPLRSLRIGSRIEVTGRVEKVGTSLRMTNPVYRVKTVGKSGRVAKRNLTNEGKSLSVLRDKTIRRPSDSADRQSKKQPSNQSSSFQRPQPKRTDFEQKLHEKMEQQSSLSASHLAERCSSCGALVANGASHDC